MVVAPCATVPANPAALMVAAAVLEELQFTELVMFWVPPSVKVPVAANCCVRPAATEGFAGVTLMDTTAGADTVRAAEPVTEPDDAVMLVLPTPSVVANPAALIVATAGLPDAQPTVPVRFCVLPSV